MTNEELEKRVDRLERIAAEQDAQIVAMQTLIESLVCVEPNAQTVLAKFQEQIGQMTQGAPSELDPEQIVEFRARALQMVLSLELLIAASA